MVNFLFTDIEDSSGHWEKYPVDMGSALQQHDAIVRAAMHGGEVFKTVGDAFCVAFLDPLDALRAALSAQRNLLSADWGVIGRLRVRMGLHRGEADFQGGDFFGTTVNRVARICSAGHGEQILVSQAMVSTLPADAGYDFLCLGDFRLRNLNLVERIYQVRGEGLPLSFPPLRSQQNLPHNLPTASSSFVGRAGDVEKIKSLLLNARVVTLIGSGGTGKTRLALESARELIETFEDGVWLIELATLGAEASLYEVLAGVFSLREEQGKPLEETIFAFLHDKKILLVLDNCEHIIPKVAHVISMLLKHSAGLRFLLTSRQAIHASGEITFSVKPLTVWNVYDEGQEHSPTVKSLVAFDAVRLFVDRAQAILPGFQLTEENASHIAKICWRLDGIPLALELAAARLRILTPAQISERLNDQFRLLRGQTPSALPHQQTMRTLIDWSYELLTPAEKILFRRLGVFAGGRSLEAVEAVCAGGEVSLDDILDLLQQLAEKNLVSVEPTPDGTLRYTLLESVWQYAREKLQSDGDFYLLRDAHLAYYVRLTESASPHLFGHNPAPWIRLLDGDLLNLRLALEWAAESPTSTGHGLRLVAALQRFWEVRGNSEETLRHSEAIFLRDDSERFPEALGLGLLSAARIAWTQDRYAEGREFLRQAIPLFEATSLTENYGLAIASDGFLAWSLDLKDEAAQLFQRASEIGDALPDLRIQAIALAGRGNILAAAGDLTGDYKLKVRALSILREVGDKWIIGYSLWGVALACLHLGKSEESRAALREWSAIAKELNNHWVKPYILQHLAEASRMEGQLELAARLFGAAEALREKIGIRFASSEQADYQATIQTLREQLPPATLAIFWEAGRHLRPDAALDLAFATQ